MLYVTLLLLIELNVYQQYCINKIPLYNYMLYALMLIQACNVDNTVSCNCNHNHYHHTIKSQSMWDACAVRDALFPHRANLCDSRAPAKFVMCGRLPCVCISWASRGGGGGHDDDLEAAVATADASCPPRRIKQTGLSAGGKVHDERTVCASANPHNSSASAIAICEFLRDEGQKGAGGRVVMWCIEWKTWEAENKQESQRKYRCKRKRVL